MSTIPWYSNTILTFAIKGNCSVLSQDLAKCAASYYSALSICWVLWSSSDSNERSSWDTEIRRCWNWWAVVINSNANIARALSNYCVVCSNRRKVNSLNILVVNLYRVDFAVLSLNWRRLDSQYVILIIWRIYTDVSQIDNAGIRSQINACLTFAIEINSYMLINYLLESLRSYYSAFSISWLLWGSSNTNESTWNYTNSFWLIYT